MCGAYVYILTNKNNAVLYTGVTSDLVRRVFEHRHKMVDGFSKRYNAVKLIYVETHGTINEAIAREKQIKGWLRVKKIKLIESINPGWKDLSRDLS